MMYMHHKSPSSSCACTALRKASRAVTRLYDEALGDTGMTIVQFSVLRNLQREGDLPLMQLADMLVMERTTLYRALAPLERQGWVSIGDGAGRAKTASLTAAGAEAVIASTAAWQRAQRKLLAAIGAEDWNTLDASLGRLVNAAQGLGS
jgi:DNA-binding MarR family transcriptional regulator